MLHVYVGGQESRTEQLTFHLTGRAGEEKKAMEIKRVTKLRTVGQRMYPYYRMWPHPVDLLKATQKGQQPHIMAMEVSHREEPDKHPE